MIIFAISNYLYYYEKTTKTNALMFVVPFAESC